MAKLQINIPEGLGDVLSKEELKHVLGGVGSEGSEAPQGSEKIRCNHSCSEDSDCEKKCPHCQSAPGTGGVKYCYAAPATSED